MAKLTAQAESSVRGLTLTSTSFGMQADLVVVDTKALNLWPAHDPITAVLQASIANTEAVMIAGRWRKRHYTLVDSNIVEVK